MERDIAHLVDVAAPASARGNVSCLRTLPRYRQVRTTSGWMEFWAIADDRRVGVRLSMEPVGGRCLMGAFCDADRLDDPYRLRGGVDRAVDIVPDVCKFPDVAKFAGTSPADVDLLHLRVGGVSLGDEPKSRVPSRSDNCLLSDYDCFAGLLADTHVSREGVRADQQQAHFEGRD